MGCFLSLGVSLCIVSLCSMVEGSDIRFYAHRLLVDPHRLNERPLHSASRLSTSTGAVLKSVTVSCVLILVQLNKCVVVCSLFCKGGIVVMVRIYVDFV